MDVSRVCVAKFDPRQTTDPAVGCVDGGMREYRSKVLKTEADYPHIIELAVPADGLATALGRQILAFHKSRRIKPRHGRVKQRAGQFYYRWCFSDLATAGAFLEQFGGAVVCLDAHSRGF